MLNAVTIDGLWHHEKNHNYHFKWIHDSMADLHLLLDGRRLKAQARERRQAMQRILYEALRDAIAQGRLQAGAVLPSSRDLARDLAMARNGVIYAY